MRFPALFAADSSPSGPPPPVPDEATSPVPDEATAPVPDEATAEFLEYMQHDAFWWVLIPLSVAAFTLSVVLLRAVFRVAGREELEEPKWNGVDVLVALLFWLAVEFLFAGSAGVLQRTLGLDPERADTLRFGLLLFAKLIVIVFVLALPLARHRQSPRALGIDLLGFPAAVWKGLLFWVVIVPGVLGTMILWKSVLLALGRDAGEQQVVLILQRAVDGGDTILVCMIATVAIVIAPLLEELLFRGLFHRWLESRLPASAAVVISALVFSAIHWNLLAFVPIFLLGMVLALILRRTGNLWNCVMLHAYFNGIQFLIALAL